MRRTLLLLLVLLLGFNLFAQDKELSNRLINSYHKSKAVAFSKSAGIKNKLWLTPLLAEATRNWDKLTPEAKELFITHKSRPSYSGDVETVVYGFYAFHYTTNSIEEGENVDPTDSNGNDIPDYVDEVIAMFDYIYDLYHVENNFIVPPVVDPDDYPYYDVYIWDPGPGYYGYVATEYEIGDNPNSPDITEVDAASSYMVLRSSYDGFGDDPDIALRVTAAHEYMHSVQNGYTRTMDVWMMEMGATWSEEFAYPGDDDNFQYLMSYYSNPDVAFNLSNGEDPDFDNHWYVTWLFAKYLTENTENDIIRSIYERCIFYNAVYAIDLELQENWSTTLEEQFRNFVVASYVLSNNPDDTPFKFERANDYLTYVLNNGGIKHEATFNFDGTDIEFDSEVDGNEKLMRFSADYFYMESDQNFVITLTPTNDDDELELVLVKVNETSSNFEVQIPDSKTGEMSIAVDDFAKWEYFVPMVIRHDHYNTDIQSAQYNLSIVPFQTNEFAGGSGTVSDPYQVATAEHLNNVRNHMDAHFIQTADIDLGVAPWNEANGWNPVGDSGNSFTGVYNGNGKVIDRLTINRPDASIPVGLFGYALNCEIKNLGVTNVSIVGNGWVGSISGITFNGTTQNCYSSGNLEGTENVGGLVGLNAGASGRISTSFSAANVTATTVFAKVGGLVGNNHSALIEDCYSLGNVSHTGTTESYTGFGGFVGSNVNNATVVRCYSTGWVKQNGSIASDKGFCGVYQNGYMANNFWDMGTSGATSTAGTATGKTSTEMKALSTFTEAGWDIGDDKKWAIAAIKNNGYPYLSWQTFEEVPGDAMWTYQQSNSTYDLKSVFFLNDNTGWIAGWNNTLLRTTDGGTTWTPASSGINHAMQNVFFANQNTGWAVSLYGGIFKSADGGDTWSTQNSGTSNGLNGLWMVDESTGFIAGNWKVYKTTDGGENWVSKFDANVNTTDIFFINNVGFVCGSSSGNPGLIYKSTDLGENWTQIYQTPNNSDFITSIMFVDSNTGYAAGHNHNYDAVVKGFILKTTDGGTNWERIHENTETYINDVHFTSALVGYAAGGNSSGFGGGKIWKTTDGGANWIEMEYDSNPPSDAINKLYFSANSVGYAVGNGGIVMKINTSSSSGETEIFEVTNPITGRTWMDRNLGASRVATSSNDAESYGNLYQWGRYSDGHELRTSNTTAALSATVNPGHGDFITPNNPPYDWVNPQNDNLWQGEEGINNPCPTGFRLPTYDEFYEEMQSWTSQNSEGAFSSHLKLPLAGNRGYYDGMLNYVGEDGYYWTSTVDGNSSYFAYIHGGGLSSNLYRSFGFSIRCIKELGDQPTLATLTTTAVTNITQTSASSGGAITNDGGASITAKGVVWGTAANPTLEVNSGYTSNGTGNVEFNSEITGLTPSTTYYVRAYATNSAGTAYGDQKEFTTLEESQTITLCEALDNCDFTFTTGGNANWFAQINTTNDGVDAVQSGSITHDEISWFETKVQGPAEISFWWKVSSESEYDFLTFSVNGNLEEFISGETSWAKVNFTLKSGENTLIWAYSKDDVVSSGEDCGWVDQFIYTEINATVPSLTTKAVTNITQTSASSGGVITSNGGADITAKGVVWSTSANPTLDANSGFTSNGTGTDEFNSEITGLAANTTYFVRAYATNSEGTAYGNALEFTTEEEESNEFAGGIGTQADPWQVATPEHLNNVRNYLGNDHVDKYFVQIDNINLDQAPWNAGEGWVPIGGETGGYFTANYDGANYSISGLLINRPNANYQGLFGMVQNGVIKNVSLLSANVKGEAYVGALLGWSSMATIEGCSAESIVVGEGEYAAAVGGLAGYNYKTTMLGCSSSSTVTGDYFVGGLVGNNNESVYSECFSSGTVTGMVEEAGGLIGRNYVNTIINECYSTAKVTGKSVVGGFVGYNVSSSISNSYATGSVENSGNGISFGGFVGYNQNTSSITNCYSIGLVNSNTFNSGGFSGTNSATISASYWNTTTSGKTQSTGGTGLQTSQMLTHISFSGWDFSSIWDNIADVTYPFLKWQGGAEVHNYPDVSVPVVATMAVTNITQTSASTGGSITNDGGTSITAKGVVWSTSENPTIPGSKTDDGSGTAEFTSEITGLTPSTTYYVRAYATNSAGTGYGDQKEFTTLEESITIALCEALDNCDFSFSTGGNAQWFGQSIVTHDGVDAVQSGNISDNESSLIETTVQGPAEISFWWKVSSEEGYDNLIFYINDQEMHRISGETVWEQQSYTLGDGEHILTWIYTKDASESIGDDCGWLDQFIYNEISVTVPSLITTSVTNITQTSASSGGAITSDGGADITAKGVVWGTSANPTLEVNSGITSNETGIAEYNSEITGLTANTTYYVRAYATNSAGTGYGDQKEFTTLEESITIALCEALDNCDFSFSTGGNAQWFGQSIVTHDGVDAVQSGNISDNESSLIETTVQGPAEISFWWKVSSEEGYDNLIFYINDQEMHRISGETVWEQQSYTLGDGEHILTWIYTKDASESIGDDCGWVDQFMFTPINIPTIATNDITEITQTSAISGGVLYGDGGAEISMKGVVWSTSQNPTLGSNDGSTTDGEGLGNFTSNLTGLSPNTTYYVRAYASNAAGTAYGNEKSFTTSATNVKIDSFSSVKAYPNPFTSNLNLTSEKGFKSISVTNVSGQVILVVELSGEFSHRLETEELQSGFYILNFVEVDGTNSRVRIIKR